MTIMFNIKKDKLNNRTVKELKAICREQGWRGYSKLRKAQLVEFICSQELNERYEDYDFIDSNISIMRLENIEPEHLEYGYKNGKYYAYAYGQFDFEITEKDFYNIPDDDIFDCFTGEHIDMKRWREGYEDDQIEQAKRGNTLLYLQSLEELLLLPPSEFRELATKLDCVQYENEYPGEFYVRVWQAYTLGNHAEKIEEQEQKGSYSMYHSMSQENKDDDEFDFMPFTDYEYFNQDEIGRITPTRSYQKWLELEESKQSLNKMFNLPIEVLDEDEDVIPF